MMDEACWEFDRCICVTEHLRHLRPASIGHRFNLGERPCFDFPTRKRRGLACGPLTAKFSNFGPAIGYRLFEGSTAQRRRARRYHLRDKPRRYCGKPLLRSLAKLSDPLELRLESCNYAVQFANA